MQLFDIDHVYPCTPPGYEGSGLVIHASVVTSPEFNAAVQEQRGLAPEKVSEKTLALVCSKIKKIEGYTTSSGREIVTGEDLYKYGHPDIWSFVEKAVFSARMLSAAQVKN